MADYLLPEAQLSSENKCQCFSLRTEIYENPFNYGDKILCSRGCLEEQTNAHFLNWNRTNHKIEALKYEREKKKLNGPLHFKIEIFKKFESNINIRKQPWDSV